MIFIINILSIFLFTSSVCEPLQTSPILETIDPFQGRRAYDTYSEVDLYLPSLDADIYHTRPDQVDIANRECKTSVLFNENNRYVSGRAMQSTRI